MRRIWLLLPLVALTAPWMGCSSTRSIETLPPRPATAIDTSTAALRAAGLGRLEVLLAVEGAPLSGEVQRLQLRVSEVRFRQADGTWLSFPASAGRFTISADQATERNILNTQVPPAQFDSLEIQFADLYVEFGANAGSALTTGNPPRSMQALRMHPEVGRTSRIRVTLNPGASLVQDHACRWHFLPFMTAEEADQ